MHKFYLLIILGLVVLMSLEFKYFSDHYAYLNSLVTYFLTHCKS